MSHDSKSEDSKPSTKIGNAMNWVLKSAAALAVIAVALIQLKFPTRSELEKATSEYRLELEKATSEYKAELKDFGSKVQASTEKISELVIEMRVSQSTAARNAEVIRDHESRIRVIEAKMMETKRP